MSGPYWSERQGRGPRQTVDLQTAIGMFAAVVDVAFNKDWFQEQFGYFCVDAGETPGVSGDTIDHMILFDLGRTGVWPPKETSPYDEDTLFDLIEWVHEHISAGDQETGYYHSFNECGWHYSNFEAERARSEYRKRINRILSRYESGYELGADGHIRHSVPDTTRTIVEAAKNLPAANDSSISSEVSHAIEKYYRRQSTPTDRRDAVRDLAGVLERLRPLAKEKLFAKDEAKLFEIANTFGIRHNNASQNVDFDTAVWWEWMFHIYLSTITALMRIADRPDESLPTADPTADGGETGEAPF